MSSFINLTRNHCNTLHLTRCFHYISRHKIYAAPSAIRRPPLFRWQSNMSNFLDLNSKVAKDVILFKYDNPKYFHYLNLFAIGQVVFWSYLSHFAYTTLRDAPVPEAREGVELKWYERINLGENKNRNIIAFSCLIIGYGVLAVAWLYTLRCVRFLILRKGGKEVALVTYTPFTGNRIMTVPLNCISAVASRRDAGVHLPIKVRNRALYYILDMRGEFRNPALFDVTAGLKRNFRF